MKNYDFQDPPQSEPHTFLGSLIVTVLIFGIGGAAAGILTLIGGDGIQFNKGSALIGLGAFVFIYLVVLCQNLLARRVGKKTSEKLIVRSFLTLVMVALVALAIWTNLK